MENMPELLVSADEMNCKIYCDILKQEGIKFEVKESSIKAAYAGASFFGKDIFVLNCDLEKAKTVLGLDVEE